MMYLRDLDREQALFRQRLFMAVVIVLSMLLLLLGRMLDLQLFSAEQYRTLAANNRLSVEPVQPVRGRVLDRLGRVLADNRPAYQVRWKKLKPKQRSTLIQRLSALPDAEQAEGWVMRLIRAVKQGNHHALPVNDAEAARMLVHPELADWIQVEASLYRYYPYGLLTAHMLGYVGRINEQDLKRLDPKAYWQAETTGKTGIERFYEQRLRGTQGRRQVEKDAQSHPVRSQILKEAVRGQDMTLSLDIAWQQQAYNMLGDNNGAAVMLTLPDRAVRVMVSKPSFDANAFVRGISVKGYQTLQNDPNRPLFNRVLNGAYPPGSTIKPWVALAGLEYGVVTADETVSCRGWYQLPGKKHRYRDWKHSGHGKMDVKHALARSCDVYFYELAHRLGIDRFSHFLALSGLGQYTGIDLPHESHALLPDRAWKRRVRKQPWYPGETLIAGIGQGFVQATPLQLVMATAVLAERGRRSRPHLWQQRPLQQQSRVHLRQPSYWQHVIDGMEAVVHAPYGTARRVRPKGYHLAGKTGTAQVVGIKQGERYHAAKLAKKYQDHALFIAFAPVDDPQVAVSVVVENGGSGSRTAAPIAAALIDLYMQSVAQTAGRHE